MADLVFQVIDAATSPPTVAPIKLHDNGDGTYAVATTATVTGGGDASAAKQDTQITAEQAILAKLLAAPATEAKQDTQITALGTLNTTANFDTKTGSLTETAPASDTASSGMNGRLQRVAQNITTLFGRFVAAALLADGAAAPTTTMVGASNMLYNGATFDLQRANVEATALTSAARTATTNSADIVNNNARLIVLFLNITVASGTGGLQIVVQDKDPVSAAYGQINTSPTAIIATGLKMYVVGTNAGAGTSNFLQAASAPIGRTIRISVIHGDASSYTYSVGYCLVI